MFFFHMLSFLPVPRRKEEKGKERKGGRNEKRGKGKGRKKQKKLKTSPILDSWKCARDNVANVFHQCLKNQAWKAAPLSHTL